MNIRKLKEIVDMTVSRLKDDEDPVVCVELEEPSVGAGASEEINFANRGMDWERQQFRLIPKTSLIHASKRPEPREIEVKTFSGVSFNGCSACGLKVALDDGYCRHCGQRLTTIKRNR